MTESHRKIKTGDTWGLFLEPFYFFLCCRYSLRGSLISVTSDCHCLSFVKVLAWKQGCGLRKGVTLLIKNSCLVDQWKGVFHRSAGSFTGLGPLDQWICWVLF